MDFTPEDLNDKTMKFVVK